jgi:transposase
MACASDAQWGNMIFSDEKKWNFDGPDGLRYEYVDKRKPEELNMRRHTGGGSVMVWGAFCKSGKSELKFLVGRQDSEAYISTLQTHLQPFIQSGSQIFQQDNAPIHTSSRTIEWISSQNITITEWPALSPDLNPIENLWGIMSQRVYACGRQYNSIVELKKAILTAWNEIPSFILEKLIESMRRRCIKVLKARGAYISY